MAGDPGLYPHYTDCRCHNCGAMFYAVATSQPTTRTTEFSYGVASSWTPPTATVVMKKPKPLWLLETEKKIARRFGIPARP